MRSQGVELSEAESILREGGFTTADLRDPQKHGEIAALFANHGMRLSGKGAAVVIGIVAGTVAVVGVQALTRLTVQG
jgi:hypothetical protein